MLSVSVQAGGESRRMGENKALKPFLGRPLIERVLGRFGPIADELFVTTNEPGSLDFLNVRQERDLRPGLGALGGLYTALCAAHFDTVFVVACDMPFANPSLAVASAAILKQEGADVVIAEMAEGHEPMHAAYRRDTCIPAIEASMDAGQRRVISWFPRVKVRRLTPEEVQRYDPDGLAFWNVNTPEEFAEAEDRALKQQQAS